ncbi:FtsX-like permease family protein [Streptomyces sp. NPDC086519]|uniref:ABC transporter permease n=1 Tax=Streptomyces sp. NPDC086519 TaxID=3154863 RepID=UPI00343FB87D
MTTSVTWRASVLGSQLAELLRRPARMLTTGSSVLVAAFVVFATVMAQQITENTARAHFRGTPAAVSLAVTDTDASIGPAALRRIRALPGVAEVAARADAGAPVSGGLSQNYLQLRADPGTGPLSRVRLVEGSYPDGPGRIAVNRPAAEELRLAPGRRITLLFPDPGNPEKTIRSTLTVTGVVSGATNADRDAAGYATGQNILRIAALSGYSRLDIRTVNGADTQEIARRVRDVLRTPSPHALVSSGDTIRAAEARAALAQYREIFQLIAVFLAVAVGAAALVATSAFRIVFAQRLRQLALLRAIGAQRRQLVTALVAEGALAGATAGTLGVLAAWGAGHLAPSAARAAGQDLAAPGFPAAQAALVIAGAVLVTAGAVLAPARSASHVPPLQALRAASTVTAEHRLHPARLATGLFLAVTALGLVALLLSDLPQPGAGGYERDVTSLLVTVASAALAFLALITLGPLLVRPVLAVAGWPLRRLGTTGRLAVGVVGGAPRRAAAVSVVVALGVALVGGALVAVACLGGYTDRKLAVEAPADFRVTDAKGFPPALVQRLAASPRLSDVLAYRTLDITVGQTRQTVSDLDLRALPTAHDIDTATGSLNALRPGEVIVAAVLADDLGVRAGDTVGLPAPHGRLRLTVAATLAGDGPVGTGLFVTPADLGRLGAAARPTGILANASSGGLAARGEARRALEAAVAAQVPDPDEAALDVPAELRDVTLGDIRLMGTTALGLVGLTILIAVVGVVTTTSLTAVERTREFGLLRALGLGRGSLRRTVAVEAALYGALGGILGLALGVPYAWLAVRLAVAPAPLLLPTGRLLTVFVTLTAVTALAGLLPARRAGRATPMAALGDTE